MDDVNLVGAMLRTLAWITKQLRGYNYSKQTLVSQLGWEIAGSERDVRLGSKKTRRRRRRRWIEEKKEEEDKGKEIEEKVK